MIIIRKYTQKTNYTCGPACLKIVSDFYGDSHTEIFLRELAETSKEWGTNHRNMVRAARAIGYTVRSRNKISIKDVESIITRGFPVIVDYENWGDGHYSVVTKIDDTHVHLADPGNIDNGFSVLTKKEFLYRWCYDRGCYYDDPDERAAKWAMLMVPREQRWKLKDLLPRDN
jgi:ATP-binding cassette, subfamily B, bacterial